MVVMSLSSPRRATRCHVPLLALVLMGPCCRSTPDNEQLAVQIDFAQCSICEKSGDREEVEIWLTRGVPGGEERCVIEHGLGKTDSDLSLKSLHLTPGEEVRIVAEVSCKLPSNDSEIKFARCIASEVITVANDSKILISAFKEEELPGRCDLYHVKKIPPCSSLVEASGTVSPEKGSDGGIECNTKNIEGDYLNPSCDTEVIQNGVTAVDHWYYCNEDYWMIFSGRKWWQYDPRATKFVYSGSDISQHFRNSFSPDCGTVTPEGSPLNPGCDASFKKGVVTAAGRFFSSSQNVWQVIDDTRYWDLLIEPGKFSRIGNDISQLFRQAAPSSSEVKSSTGGYVNPGFDEDVKQGRITAVSQWNFGKENVWIIFSGIKWWWFDLDTAEFKDPGKEMITYFAENKPPCSETPVNGMHPNPGCDSSFKEKGVTAAGQWSFGDKNVLQIISDKKWWEYDPTKGEFTASGSDIMSIYRSYDPH
jgi:hypothetical protein